MLFTGYFRRRWRCRGTKGRAAICRDIGSAIQCYARPVPERANRTDAEGVTAHLPAHALEMTKPLLRSVADMSWEQAIAMDEFAEPMCFTTEAHRGAVNRPLDRSGTAPR